MRLIKFTPLQIDSTKVRVEWTLDPPSPIYRESGFDLDYGNAMDPRQLPLAFWWTLIILIVHSHWNLFRPCRVILPVMLRPGEIEFWLRLLDQERVSLERYRQTTDFKRTIEIVCEGPLLEPAILPPAVDRWATAFSGGKDSLGQTGLLCELTKKPLLVNTCSPMPPLIDNEWPYRDRTLKEIVRRRDVELVVVNSNFRQIWPHYEAPHQLGYPLSLGQMGDPYLVLANTLAVAASRGVRSVTLATEVENARMEEYEGKVAFYDFNLACAVPTLIAVDRLVRRFGMNVSSLLWPFNHLQIEYLIRRRYSELADLQISCFWMKEPTERSCSRCVKCLRVAMMLMSMGDDPATLDLDLGKMFAANHDYDPKRAQMTGRTIPYVAATMDRLKVKEFFPRQGLLEKLGLTEPRAFTKFNKMADIFAENALSSVEATHAAYFQYVPQALRERIRAISLEYWPEVDTTEYLPDEANINSLANWLTVTI